MASISDVCLQLLSRTIEKKNDGNERAPPKVKNTYGCSPAGGNVAPAQDDICHVVVVRGGLCLVLYLL